MKRKIIYIVVFISSGYLLYNVVATPYIHGPMMFVHYGYYDEPNLYSIVTRSVGIFLFLLGIFLFIIAISKNKSQNNDALTVLKMRVANGDITVDEYKIMKKEIDT